MIERNSTNPTDSKIGCLSWLVRVDFRPPSCWPFRFCVPFIGCKILHFFLFSQLSVIKVGFSKGLLQLNIFLVKKRRNTVTTVQSDEIAALTDSREQTTYCLNTLAVLQA